MGRLRSFKNIIHSRLWISYQRESTVPWEYATNFLPMTCEGCHDTFCDEHWKFGSHNCPKEQDIIQSRIVPTCPVCGVVVPVKRGEDPNLRVHPIYTDNGGTNTELQMEQHIARNCADPGKAATNPVFTNQ
eukprot:Partr_v1_DN27589_c0_g1_i6_m30287 putative zinc finger